MIEVKNLYLKYIREYYALYNINIKVAEGECVAFTGEENSGRTTLLRAIAGLEKFDKGEIFINGRDIQHVDFSTDIQMGYIPITPVFFNNKTVYDNLKYVLKERKISNLDMENMINSVLINFKIEKYKNIKIQDLDLYEKYLISFVRLALRKIDILLIDDIFDKLSEDEANAFISLIKDLFVLNGTTVIVVSKSFEQVKDLCSREIHFVLGSIEE